MKYRGVHRGVFRGAISSTSSATPTSPTLGATPKLLNAPPKDFGTSEKAKQSLEMPPPPTLLVYLVYSFEMNGLYDIGVIRKGGGS